MLPLGDAKQPARVIRQKRDVDSAPIGQASTNPYLDTSLYKVEFNDGHVEAYSANLIAESIYEQLDDEGNKNRLIDEIIGHEKDSSAVPTSEATIIVNGRQHPKRTTRGWRLCIQWKDRTTSWERLKDLKESNPVELAE